jgi:hypothetical protein
MRSGIVCVVCAFVACLALPGRAAASWCGTDETAADRRPDFVASYQFHVVYAAPSDAADRFFEVAPAIARDIEAVGTWWRREDPTRTPRFDLHAFANCSADADRLDISSVRLAHDTAYYRDATSSYNRIWADLDSFIISQSLSPWKKFLVYYDGGRDGNVCGTATNNRPERGGTVEVVYLVQPRCGWVGGGNWLALTAVHEMIHDLGALPTPGPPHPCVGDDAHVCDTGMDVMFPGGTCCTLFDHVLDYNRDDYYGHRGSWLDVRNSLWLRHLDGPQFPLAVTTSGSTTAQITTEPGGIECPDACTATWDAGSQVTLVAPQRDGRQRFVRWSGGCTGTSTRCTVIVNAATTVTATYATFTPPGLALSVSVRGPGRVVGTVACRSGRCVRSLASGAVARLRAIPASGAHFTGWQGACRGTDGCVVRMRHAAAVTATFTR